MATARIDIDTKAEGPDLRIQLTKDLVRALLEDSAVEIKSPGSVLLSEAALTILFPDLPNENEDYVRLGLEVLDEIEDAGDDAWAGLPTIRPASLFTFTMTLPCRRDRLAPVGTNRTHWNSSTQAEGSPQMTCTMVQQADGWHCLTHETPAWDSAVALGAKVPCQMPRGKSTRIHKAKSAKTRDRTLLLLSRDSAAEVRQFVARNPNCSDEILTTLATDSAYLVRMTVAFSCSKTLVHLLSMLATDNIAGVRWLVAGNPNTAMATLQKLALDTDPSVKATAEAMIEELP